MKKYLRRISVCLMSVYILMPGTVIGRTYNNSVDVCKGSHVLTSSIYSSVNNNVHDEIRNFVSVERGGTLRNTMEKLMGEGCNYLTDLKISGLLNQIDLRYIASLPRLENLDLSDVSIQAVLSFQKDEIPSKCFIGQVNIKTVILPDKTVSIGEESFAGSCIEKIYFPTSCKYIGRRAFADCKMLVAPVLRDGLIMIREKAFEGCTAMKEFFVPKTVKGIGIGAFKNCTALENFQMAADCELRFLNEGLFENCVNLDYVVLASNIKALGKNVFKGTESIKTIFADPLLSPYLDDNKVISHLPALTTIYVSSDSKVVYKKRKGWRGVRNRTLENDSVTRKKISDIFIADNKTKEPIPVTGIKPLVNEKPVIVKNDSTKKEVQEVILDQNNKSFPLLAENNTSQLKKEKASVTVPVHKAIEENKNIVTVDKTVIAHKKIVKENPLQTEEKKPEEKEVPKQVEEKEKVPQTTKEIEPVEVEPAVVFTDDSKVCVRATREIKNAFVFIRGGKYIMGRKSDEFNWTFKLNRNLVKTVRVNYTDGTFETIKYAR